MWYPFEREDGELVDLEYKPDDAPEIGAIVLDEEGRKCRRLASIPQVHGAHDGSSNFPRFESHQLPRWWKHHKGEFSPSGKPRYSSRKEIEEDMSRARHAGTEIEYGEL